MKDEIIDKINKLTTWYRDNSYKCDINKLLDFQDKLCTLLFNLSDLYSEFSQNYNLSYIQRKYDFATNKMNFRNTNKNVSDCENLAEIEAKEQREIEVKYYEIAQKLNLLRQDARLLIQLCTQRISHLKHESEYSKIQNQT
ncbi:hypothetical protein [Massilibacteroides sp.]|uniref:hypothetical protein n=1 Tax=Massilibacteroides sp. TaxID=2034766 RepID=UPI00262AE530|nr:hypothetical protein [Massilibacteroides sp.]MDD4515679.1 hypothetical protein [Massilibacteroides sp.]